MKRWMKVVSFVGTVIILITGLTACGSSRSTVKHSTAGYETSVSKGLDAVAENQMNKALTYFENALTQKPKDKKAQAYRNQVQAYLDTKSQLKDGNVQQAVTTATNGEKISRGAKSLTTKLTNLKTTAKADLKKYQQLDKDVTAQLKVTDSNYSSVVIKQCQQVDWNKQSYLIKLKPKVNKLLKQARQTSSMTSSNSQTTETVSAADKQTAAEMRKNIVQSEPGTWDSNALAQVPDSVIVAATKKSDEMGGDPGTTANMIAKQYPNIKKSNTDATASSDNELSASDAKSKLSSLDFYQENQSHLKITGQQQTANGWEFTWHFSGGNMGGTFNVNNDGTITAQSSGGDSVGSGSWK